MNISLQHKFNLCQRLYSYPFSCNCVVDKFVYLGSTMTLTNSLDKEWNTHMGKAATAFGRLRKRVRDNKHLSLPLKIKVYEACVLSILLHSSECWSTYRHQERRLNAFHMRNLRSILNLSWRDHVPNTVILSRPYGQVLRPTKSAGYSGLAT